jgi:hypothetical protein
LNLLFFEPLDRPEFVNGNVGHFLKGSESLCHENRRQPWLDFQGPHEQLLRCLVSTIHIISSADSIITPNVPVQARAASCASPATGG